MSRVRERVPSSLFRAATVRERLLRTQKRWFDVPLVTMALLILVSGCRKEEVKATIPSSEYAMPASMPTYRKPDGKSLRPLEFIDVTASAGIDFRHVTGAFGKKWMPETVGGGGAFFDYDSDGRPDVLLVNGAFWPGHELSESKPTSKLYRNVGPSPLGFEDVGARSGLADLSFYGMGAAIADYDGDGDEDVYITAVGKNLLLRNDGGRFVDVADSAGVGYSSCCGAPSKWEWSVGAVWVDYDRDGDLDLFVANYVQWTPETDVWTTLDGKNKSYSLPQVYDGATCVLFRNDGNGKFTDVTKQAGVYNPDGKSLSVLADDFNDDGWPDLVITNDTQPNFLYINQHDGTFRDEALLAGVAYDESGLARAGMGVSVSDIANRGPRSIAIGNFSGEPVSLYTQTSLRAFVDQAGVARLSKPTTTTLTFGVLFADFDLDGYDDLVLANGHIEPEIATVRDGWTFAQMPQLFQNDGQGQFVEVTGRAGEPFRTALVGRCVAVADVDNDGDLDVLMTENGGPARLLRNDQDRGSRAVRVRLAGDRLNPYAVGSRLRAKIGGMTISRYITTGGSYLSQSELVATFGLGDLDAISELEIRWPNGAMESVTNLAAGATYTIRRGEGVIRTKPFNSRTDG